MKKISGIIGSLAMLVLALLLVPVMLGLVGAMDATTQPGTTETLYGLWCFFLGLLQFALAAVGCVLFGISVSGGFDD